MLFKINQITRKSEKKKINMGLNEMVVYTKTYAKLTLTREKLLREAYL